MPEEAKRMIREEAQGVKEGPDCSVDTEGKVLYGMVLSLAVKLHQHADYARVRHMLGDIGIVATDNILVFLDTVDAVHNISAVKCLIDRNISGTKRALGLDDINGIAVGAEYGPHTCTACHRCENTVFFKAFFDDLSIFQLHGALPFHCFFYILTYASGFVKKGATFAEGFAKIFANVNFRPLSSYAVLYNRKRFFSKGNFMQIHRVKRGETVFHIARAYQSSPVKIIENNALERADALSVGEELLICSPTRSYTVRGTETLTEIAERFGVRVSDLLRYNPELSAGGALRPSMSLAIKYAPPQYGTAANLGYVRASTSTQKIKEALPYLTYFVFDGGFGDGCEIYGDVAHSEGLAAVRTERKIPLLRIQSRDMQESFYKCSSVREEFIGKMIALAKAHGYLGLVLSEDIFMLPTKRERDAFLLQLRKHLLGSDLILFCECSGAGEFGDFADANILLPSYLARKTEYSIEHKLHHASGVYETQKTFLGVPTYATDGECTVPYSRMRQLAYATKHEFLHGDDEAFFDYTRYIGGKRERRHIRALSLGAMHRSLTLLSEYGFMGAALEVEHFTVPCRLMLTLMFSGVEYAFGSA